MNTVAENAIGRVCLLTGSVLGALAILIDLYGNTAEITSQVIASLVATLIYLLVWASMICDLALHTWKPRRISFLIVILGFMATFGLSLAAIIEGSFAWLAIILLGHLGLLTIVVISHGSNYKSKLVIPVLFSIICVVRLSTRDPFFRTSLLNVMWNSGSIARNPFDTTAATSLAIRCVMTTFVICYSLQLWGEVFMRYVTRPSSRNAT